MIIFINSMFLYIYISVSLFYFRLGSYILVPLLAYFISDEYAAFLIFV